MFQDMISELLQFVIETENIRNHVLPLRDPVLYGFFPVIGQQVLLHDKQGLSQDILLPFRDDMHTIIPFAYFVGKLGIPVYRFIFFIDFLLKISQFFFVRGYTVGALYRH